MIVRYLTINAFVASFFQVQAATAPSITVNPSAAEVRLGDTRQFTSAATGLPAGTSPVWLALAVANGKVSATGLYTAPTVLPSPNTIMVKASNSATAPTVTGSATVTLLNPIPVITVMQPAGMNVGLQSTVIITGVGFIPASRLMIGGTPVAAAKFIVKSDTEIDYTDTPAVAATVQVTVVNPDPGTRTSGARALTIRPAVEVLLSPDKRTIRGGTMLALAVSVKNNADQRVKWFVNGKAGGDAVLGTITTDAKGQVDYHAPDAIPGASVTLSASSLADPKAQAQITVNLQNPTPLITAVNPAPVEIDSTPTLTITGSGFAAGALVYVNGKAFATQVSSGTVLKATGKIEAVPGRVLPVKVTNPDPGTITSMAFNIIETAPKNCKDASNKAVECMAFADAVRLLEMATWGPTPASIAHLQEIGRDKWFLEQFAAPATAWPLATSLNEGANRIRQEFFTRALTGNDQLRQRVAFALSQIFVVSGQKDTRYEAMRSYTVALSDNAFLGYRNLLGVMTLNPSMGWFLDMVNNDKANLVKNTVANENYAREVMQLFSLGLVTLDSGGTSTGTPTYTQDTVTQLAKVFTGWTYPRILGTAGQWRNDQYFEGPMEPFADHHDDTAKTIQLAGQSACVMNAGSHQAQDLTDALDCIAKHPNVAPFISYRLIQRLVKSSPSTAYVSDVVAVFKAKQGNLGEVVKAILTHSEATAAGSGKLREPVLYATALLRALDATVAAAGASGIADQTKLMGQDALNPPSVFNYFSPFYKVPGFGVVAPEFQGFNASTGLSRLNFAYRAVNNQVSGNIRVDLTKWQDLQADSDVLMNAIDEALYHGKMDSALKTYLTGVAKATNTNPATRARKMLYLAAAAPEYQVEQ